jgi:predicted amidohydrolase YtcJ
MHGVSVPSLLLAGLFVAQTLSAQQPPSPDEIFIGSFITLDSSNPRAEAVAVRDGRIIAVGSRAVVGSLATGSTRQTVLPGIALPGFIDAHAHPHFLGELLEGLDLARLSKEQILQRVRTASTAADSSAWIRGSGWDQEFWRPPEFPVAAELDSVSADHLVMLDRVDGHAVWVNSRALQAAGITRDTVDPSGGKIVRDAHGDPSGVLVDSAIDLVTRVVPAPSEADVERRLRAAMAQYMKWGLTGVHDAGASLREIDVYRKLAERGELAVRMYVMASAQGSTFDRTLERGPEVGLGGGMLTIRSVKVVLDGALGSRGAKLSAPYADASEERGLSLVTDAQLDSIIAEASTRGFQVNVHAIGDEATHRMLDAFERAGSTTRSLRFRDEHVSIVRDEDLPRFEQLGVIASMQPVFVGEYRRFAEARVGKARLPWVYRTRDLLQAGAIVASGTDYPASDSGDPIMTLYGMVTRRGPDGLPDGGWLPSQRVDIDAALRSMTHAAAYAAFQENELGAITVGRRADFTVLSDDPYAVTPEELRSLKVLQTVVGGRVVYEGER